MPFSLQALKRQLIYSQSPNPVPQDSNHREKSRPSPQDWHPNKIAFRVISKLDTSTIDCHQIHGANPHPPKKPQIDATKPMIFRQERSCQKGAETTERMSTNSLLAPSTTLVQSHRSTALPRQIAPINRAREDDSQHAENPASVNGKVERFLVAGFCKAVDPAG